MKQPDGRPLVSPAARLVFERQDEILDVAVAECRAQQRGDPPAPEQRYEGQRVVAQRVGGDEGAPEALAQLLVGPARGDGRLS